MHLGHMPWALMKEEEEEEEEERWPENVLTVACCNSVKLLNAIRGLSTSAIIREMSETQKEYEGRAETCCSV